MSHPDLPTTRADFVRELFRYLDPLRPHYTADGSRVVIGHASAQYEDEVIPMEAWARPLWGLAPFWVGGGRSADGFFERVYPRGLAAGTDPSSPSYWGDNRDHDQKFIEMGAIAYALLLAPHVLWEPLAPRERENVAAWLDQVNHRTTPDSNWLFMPVMVNMALKHLGMPCDEAAMRRDIARICEFHAGEGWYTDGPARAGVLDYYSAFAMHMDSLAYARFEGSDDPEHAALFRERARLFARQYVRLFGASGEAVPFGRSMTYRFAVSSFFSEAVAVDHAAGSGKHADVSTPLLDPAFTPGVLKGLIARNLAFWAERPICDNGGVLSIGYAYPNLHMAEGYNAAGSPMWALKAFACLELPEEDAFWRVEPEPLPAELAPVGVSAIGAGDMLVQRDTAGDVALYPSGREPEHPFAQSAAKYARLAYSTRFGFSVPRGSRSLAEAAPDSSLAFVVGADERHAGHVFVREGVESYRLAGGDAGESPRMVSTWSPWPGIEVETEVEPVPDAPAGTHIRRHRVTNLLGHAVDAYDCGFAVPGDYHERTLEDVERVCRVRSAGGPGAVVGEPVLIKPEANTNITCGKTLIPAVRYRIEPGGNLLVTRIEVR